MRRPADPADVHRRPSEKPKDEQLIVRALLRRAEGCRDSLAEFYGFVMRHEITKELLVPAAHQLVMFSFIEHHPRCVFRLPVGCGKTFSMAAVTLWLLGKDTTQRGAIVSKTRQQASKVLGMVSDYIEEELLNRRLVLVYPWLRKSNRPGEPWTQNMITVDRDPGIRDPSLIATGLDAALAGARLSWLVADDMIDDENTSTKQAREKVRGQFDGRLMSRMDPLDSRSVVTNTPWDLEDQTYYLEEVAGWPTITMDIYGNIKIANADAAWLRRAERDLVRPARRAGWYRLRAHDPDPDEKTPLWPDRYDAETIEEIRQRTLPHEFARLFLCQPFDEAAARCQRDWVEQCKKEGMGLTLEPRYDGMNPTFTGVDLGIGDTADHDMTVLFTFELQVDGRRRVLDIEAGRWDGHTIVKKIIQKHDDYGSVVVVEDNSAQDWMRQWVLEDRPDLSVKAHHTGLNKRHVDFGVESVFSELQQKAWIIPCDEDGKCHDEVERWIEEMLLYQPPPHHTGDRLMACWIARERARRHGRGGNRGGQGTRRRTFAVGGGF